MAITAEMRALALQHGKLGNALLREGNVNAAAAHYLQALQLDPDDAATHSNLGLALATQGKLAEAEARFRHALKLCPNYPEACNNLGTALKSQGRWEEAELCYQEALRLKPDYVEALYNLGNSGKDRELPDRAEAFYRQALAINPDHANARNNLGTVLQTQGRFHEARAQYELAVHSFPNHAEALRNLGCALEREGLLQEAMARFQAALRLRPDFAEAHHSLSMLALLLGDYETGWREYEWRWLVLKSGKRTFSKPLWDGSDLEGRAILLYAEQGIGDTLHFIRYAPLVKQRGGTVIVECQQPLVRLFSGMWGIDQLVVRGSPLPPFDVQAALLSLPGIFHTNRETIPATVPYLHVHAELVDQWRRELAARVGFKVGIAWQGNPAHKGDGLRSVPLTQFAPLAQVEGVQLVSLQKGPGAEQLRGPADPFAVLDVGSRLGDFMDTAAVMMNLDLVITCDTAVAHLAGALGVPVWVALPFAPDWRWLLHRGDSPWYPSMRLSRQTIAGDWKDAFGRMTEELRALTRKD